DRDLARHAERYAAQFQKAFPNNPPPLAGAVNLQQLMEAIRKAGAGKPAPKTETQDVTNKAFKMDDLRGKVVLVVFYTGASTQYTKVRQYLEPHLARLKNRPVALVLVASTSPTLLATKVKQDPAPPAAVLSTGTAKKTGGFNAPPFQDWGVYGTPAAVLV